MTRYRVEQMAHKYMKHDMIALHTELPDFPDGRIRLLYAVLGQQPAAASDKELLSLVTSLVQIGLDTHDMVDDGAGEGDGGMTAMRSQQLKVLAGDYFSGRFYHLLSQAGHIDAIRRLSEAVSEVNRVKMTLYWKTVRQELDSEEYLQYATELKSGLFLSFTAFMQGLYERLWPELVERFSRCELLLQELANADKLHKLSGSWGFWHIWKEGTEEDRRMLSERREDTGFMRHMMEKYDVKDKLGTLLRQTALQLQTVLGRLQSDKLARELQPLIEPFLTGSGTRPAAALKELG